MLTDATMSNKRVENITNFALEPLLVKCVYEMYNKRLVVSEEMIMERDRRLLSIENEKAPEYVRIILEFSNGWLVKFMKRHQFKSFVSYVEDRGADDDAIKRLLRAINDKLSIFTLNEIFSADEFSHFYQLTPTGTIARGNIPRIKKKKARLIYLASANVDRTDKTPLVLIEKYRNPGPFGLKSRKKLCIDYYSNKKAWMNTNLFSSGSVDLIRTLDKLKGEKQPCS